MLLRPRLLGAVFSVLVQGVKEQVIFQFARATKTINAGQRFVTDKRKIPDADALKPPNRHISRSVSNGEQRS